MNVFARILSLLVAFALVFGTAIPPSFAQTTHQTQSESSLQIDRVVEVSIEDNNGKVYTNEFFVRKGVTFDRSTFEKLPNGYKLISFTERDITAEEKKHYEEVLIKLAPSGTSDISINGFETLFDIGCLIISLNTFLNDPTWENFAWVVVDATTVAIPGIPAVGSLTTIKRMLDASSVLQKSLEIGVGTYTKLRNTKVPSGWERHHIIEKRFVSKFIHMTEGNMYAIAIPKEIHQKITNKMRQKISYGANLDDIDVSDILKAHREAYDELYDETGEQVYKFLRDYLKKGGAIGEYRNV